MNFIEKGTTSGRQIAQKKAVEHRLDIRKRASLARWPLAALAMLLTVSCSTTPQYPARPSFADSGNYAPVAAYLRKWIPAFMTEKSIPGLSIALADDTEVVWAEGFGFADRDNHMPFTAGTRSNVGSVSKLFTSAAIMKLVEEGKIDLDQPLTTYLPEFSIKTHGSPGGPRG